MLKRFGLGLLAALALAGSAGAQGISQKVAVCDPAYTARCNGASVTPVATAALASSLVAKASAGSLYGFSGYSAVSGWFLVFNAASAPADGAVTPMEAFAYTAGQAFAVDFSGDPLRGLSGLTIVFSTTGPLTKTASATAYISAKVQ